MNFDVHSEPGRIVGRVDDESSTEWKRFHFLLVAPRIPQSRGPVAGRLGFSVLPSVRAIFTSSP